MDIVLKSLKFMIGLALLVFALEIYLVVAHGVPASSLLFSLINLAMLTGFLVAFSKEVFWAAALFAPICFFDFFGAISDGFSFANSLNLVDAVFSFTAFAGMILWFKDRRALRSRDKQIVTAQLESEGK